MASLNVDPLKLYFGGEYPIDENFTIHQPTVGEIMEYGENDFYQMLNVFVGNTTMRKLDLWDIGVSWTAISDYELFCSLVCAYPTERTKILFGDNIDFTKFKLYEKTTAKNQIDQFQQKYLDQNGKPKKLTKSQRRLKAFAEFEYCNTFYDTEDGIQLNASTYHQIADILRTMFNIFPKTEYANSKLLRQELIDEARQSRSNEQKAREGKMPESVLLPLISGCVNHPGFKYKIGELKDLGIFAFMDSCKRLSVYENSVALLHGAYGGFISTKDIPPEEFNFMRELKE